MHTYRYILTILLCAWSIVALSLEKTILLGPKTIGKAWRDNIVLEPRHFADAKAGDIVTVYNDNAKGSAQGAFQNPSNWHGVAHEYDYFGIAGPFRMVLTEDILSIARTHGIAIGGHDYRILRVTLTDAAVAAGTKAQLSIRDAHWHEITGVPDPVWYPLDGTDVVYMFDPVALDKVKECTNDHYRSRNGRIFQ